MNREMLRCLVRCSDDDFVNKSEFFKHYPDTAKTRSEIRQLRDFGFLTLLEAEGEIIEIAITAKAKKV